MRSSLVPPTRASMVAHRVLAPAGPYHACEVLGFGPHRPDHRGRSVEGSFDHQVRGRARHRSSCSPVFRWLLELLEVGRPSGRSGPPTRAGTARPRWRPPRAGPASMLHGRYCACWPRTTSPARSSTLMCLEMAGRESWNGSASSLTVRLALGEARQDRASGGVGQRREGDVESILGGDRHPSSLILLIR